MPLEEEYSSLLMRMETVPASTESGRRTMTFLDLQCPGKQKPTNTYRSGYTLLNLTIVITNRSMGDSVGRECGVIAEPEIIKHIMNEDDKMMVIASDGVWEFLSNSDVSKLTT